MSKPFSALKDYIRNGCSVRVLKPVVVPNLNGPNFLYDVGTVLGPEEKWILTFWLWHRPAKDNWEIVR